MSSVRAKKDYGFVGGLGAESILVSEGDVFAANHPLVEARPELFDVVPEEPKRPILGRKPSQPVKESDDRP